MRCLPKYNDHAEKLNIDILITSKTTNKVIIIENKTFAKDRIVDGNPQLLGYGKKIIESAEFKILGMRKTFITCI